MFQKPGFKQAGIQACKTKSKVTRELILFFLVKFILLIVSASRGSGIKIQKIQLNIW
jgi:hypothetical protein